MEKPVTNTSADPAKGKTDDRPGGSPGSARDELAGPPRRRSWMRCPACRGKKRARRQRREPGEMSLAEMYALVYEPTFPCRLCEERGRVRVSSCCNAPCGAGILGQWYCLRCGQDDEPRLW